MRMYRKDDNPYLQYKEFLDIVLPKEHPDLRAFVTQRECFDISEEECLSFETENAMAILLSTEIEMFDEMKESKFWQDLNDLSA